MGKQRGTKKKTSRLLGTFTQPSGRTAVGELRLKGSSTLLKLHSDQNLACSEFVSSINGTAYSGECLTLIECRTTEDGHISITNSPDRFYANIFPHYVAIGQHHLDPAHACIEKIDFTTTDLTALSYDFDAFGCVIDAKPIIDAVLQERRKKRPVEAGEWPHVAYFSGKDCIVEVRTPIGKVSVHHRPRFSVGGPKGVFIKNRIVVSIEPERPATFHDAIHWMSDIACFLSMAAGRAQDVGQVKVTTTTKIDNVPQLLRIHPSFRWKLSDKTEKHRPHPIDVPLDPIRNRAEFEMVLANWMDRHDGWRVARYRYLECMRKVDKYGPERLVAAANMFDILPADAVPLTAELSEELAATRNASIEMFRKHPPGIDRNSALSQLGRLGKPSLPKKVAHRASIVASKLGGHFQDLQFVASVAVKCRNFFVHGSSDDIDYQKVETFVPFLTDTLEFIFAASDFIDAGWDAQRWCSVGHSWGHSFARLRSEYEEALSELRSAISPNKLA